MRKYLNCLLILVSISITTTGCGESDAQEQEKPVIIIGPAIDMSTPSEDQSADQTDLHDHGPSIDMGKHDMPDMIMDMSGDMRDMTTDEGMPGLSFERDVFPVFQSNGCSNGLFGGCHGLANPPANLDLSEASTAYTQLVNMDATTGPGKRVVPGDAQASYLMTFANQQLFGVNPITRQQITTIGLWIDDGALP